MHNYAVFDTNACCHALMPPPQPCLTHRQDRLLPASSLHGPPRLNSPWIPHCFRALLLRRLRLPLPLTAARCRCGQPHDAFGDHLAACPRSGVLRSRGCQLERAAARVCREAGATVAMHVLVRDFNVVPRDA